MQFNLDIEGAAVLVGMSLVFGIVAQLIVGLGRTRWMWLIGSVAYFLGGLLVSEWMFGWATAEDLQPNIGGLSFDEALFGGLIVGLIALGVTWFAVRQRHVHHPAPM